MSNGYDGQLMREAKELAKDYDVDLNVALRAVIGAKHAIAMYQIKDVLNDIYDTHKTRLMMDTGYDVQLAKEQGDIGSGRRW